MSRLLSRPIDERGAALGKNLLEFICTVDLTQFHLGLAGDVEVHQGQSDFRHAALSTEQRAVGLQLSPVKQPTVLGDVVGVAPDRLDLFQAASPWVIAVRASPYTQRSDGSFERDLGLVVLTAALRHEVLAEQSLDSGR